MTATKSRRLAHVIKSDDEAIAIARGVAGLLAPGASARDRGRQVPYEELEQLAASGLLAITVPKEFGGAQVSSETLVQVFQILSAADPAIGQLPQNHFVFLNAIAEDGSAPQKAFFFREILGGARLGNAQAEKGSSSALDLRTRLGRGGPGEYRLNGTKHYCTGAIAADWIPVAALDDEERLVLAYVRRGSPGVEVLTDWNAMGQRVTFSGTVHLRDVAVSAENVIEHWRLFERPSLFHSFAQLLHAAIDVGIAQNALADTANLIRKRKRARLGAPAIAPTEDTLILHRLGQLLARFHAAEGLVLRAARVLDDADSRVMPTQAIAGSIAVSEAKAYVEDVVLEITNEAFGLIGSSATDEDLNLHRHWRNARTHTVHDANQWRYHAAGNHFLNGIAPEKPFRRVADGSNPPNAETPASAGLRP